MKLSFTDVEDDNIIADNDNATAAVEGNEILGGAAPDLIEELIVDLQENSVALEDSIANDPPKTN